MPRRGTAEPTETEKNGDGDAKSVKLFVNRGERSGIEEEDLRWALREGAVLPEDAIHDVRVLHRFSFVEVAPDQAERAVEFLDGTKLRAKKSGWRSPRVKCEGWGVVRGAGFFAPLSRLSLSLAAKN